MKQSVFNRLRKKRVNKHYQSQRSARDKAKRYAQEDQE